MTSGSFCCALLSAAYCYIVNRPPESVRGDHGNGGAGSATNNVVFAPFRSLRMPHVAPHKSSLNRLPVGLKRRSGCPWADHWETSRGAVPQGGCCSVFGLNCIGSRWRTRNHPSAPPSSREKPADPEASGPAGCHSHVPAFRRQVTGTTRDRSRPLTEEAG